MEWVLVYYALEIGYVRLWCDMDMYDLWCDMDMYDLGVRLKLGGFLFISLFISFFFVLFTLIKLKLGILKLWPHTLSFWR